MSSPNLTPTDHFQALTEAKIQKLGYSHAIQDHTGKWHALTRFIYTWAICSGINEEGYSDRWCYHEFSEAEGALKDRAAGGFSDEEPKGWHRHPNSGRVDQNRYQRYK